MSNIVQSGGKVGFLREKHDLQATSDKLKKLSGKALEVLENNLMSDDPKIQMEAAKLLLKFDIDISKIINEDAMQRLLLELRENGNPPPKNTTPLIDFSNIQDV